MSLLTIFLIVPQNTFAGQSKAFFEKGSAKSVFLPKSKLAKQQKLEYFRQREDQEENNQNNISAKSNQESLESTNTNQEPSKNLANNLNDDASQKDLSPSQKVINQFGDPEKDVTYYPENNAPLPFKGMIAALQAGDDALAFKYAKQFVNYSSKEKEIVNKTIAFQKLAMEGLGKAKEGYFSNDSDMAEYKYLLEDELKKKEEEKRRAESAKAVRLSKKDDSLFNSFDNAYKTQIESSHTKAQKLYDDLENKKEENGDNIETEESINQKSQDLVLRASMEQEYKGKVPVDPKGDVSVYFFFNPMEKASLNIASAVQSLYDDMLSSKSGKLVGVSSTISSMSLESFRKYANVSFPLLKGEKLIKLMQVKDIPSVYFRCENTGEAFIFNKIPRKFELNQIFNLMKGNKDA